MNKRMFVIVAMLFLLSFGVLSAQNSPATSTPTTSGSSTSSYCTDIFNNALQGNSNYNIVSPALYNSSTFSGMLSIAFLIVLSVLLIMALVYGIGVAFGIDKLVTFARTEYMESIFNLCLIVVVAAGITSLNGIADFFTSAGATVVSTAAPTVSSGSSNINALYTGICNNILSNQITPSLGILVGMTLLNEAYTALAGFKFTITPINLLPSFTIAPYSGITPVLTFIKIMTEVIEGIVGLNIAVILLFFVIYFLFPLFLYLGIILRSFPWTRAAGGTFLALFIAFYLIFPAIAYPFTSVAQPLASSICSSATTSATTTNSLCLSATNTLLSIITVGLNLLNNAGGFLGTVVGQPGAGLNAIIYTYTSAITYFVFMLIGIFIAFIVSYDMLELLGDVLGAPSLQAGRLMGRIL